LGVRRISNSFSLARSSWAVLRQDRELAAIPFVSFLVTIVASVAVAGGIWLSLDRTTGWIAASDAYVNGRSVHTAAHWGTTYSVSPVTVVVGLIGTVLLTFVTTFFTAALVAGAHQRLTGQVPSLRSAFGAAAGRWPQLFLWSLLSGIVGLVISQIERQGLIGALVGRVIGLTWRLTTWLAVPVIVVEGTGPFASLRRSATLFRTTWGENVIAQAGFGLVSLLVLVPGLVVGTVVLAVVPIAGVVVLLAWFGITLTLIAALNGIFRTALYLHASGQRVAWFDEQALAASFRPRRSLLN
jgi:hypothetical protein